MLTLLQIVIKTNVNLFEYNTYTVVMEETDRQRDQQYQQLNKSEENHLNNSEQKETINGQKLETPSRVSQIYQEELSSVLVLLKESKWKEALPILQRYIEEKFDPQIQIDGLGNYELALGYYECFPFTWYFDGIERGKYKGTVCDILSLCYLCLRLDDEALWAAIDWYKRMMEKYQGHYQITFGYANAINNQGYYDQAVEYYTQTTRLKADFVPAYECVAYIYEYKRIQVAKSLDWAKKALAFNQKSVYSLFVLAKNEKDVDQRITKVREVIQQYPQYSRAVNYVGFIYGENKKNPEEAIIWHKKAVERNPLFDIGNYNVGMRYEQLNDYNEAINWYIQANRFDKDYRLPCDKLVHIFEKLHYTEQKIEEEVKKHKVRIDYFYFNLGKSYYDLGKTDLSLKYYFKAEKQAVQLKNELFRVYNSIGNSYFKMKEYNNSIEAFNKAISINPKCDMVYYNMANVYKDMGNIEEAKKMHKKSNEINPRYAYPYNNLGNIYVDERNYDEAIKCYKNAVKYKSNYVLAMANLGVCYLKVMNYRDAFHSISRAKELMEANIKDLSQGNKIFLRETLQKLDKEGQNWRKDGGIDLKIKHKIKQHIEQFQGNFHKLYNRIGKESVHEQKIMKKQIFQVALVLYDTQFEFNSIDFIFSLVKNLFKDNEEYFHIISQLIVHYYYKSVIVQNKSVVEIEKEVTETMKQFLKENIEVISQEKSMKNKLKGFVFKHFDLKKTVSPSIDRTFSDYKQVHGEILRINEVARDCYKQYKQLINKVRTQSKGIPYGVVARIPKFEREQFKQIIGIFKKIYEAQLNQARITEINKKISEIAASKQKLHKEYLITSQNIMNDIQEVWINEINSIIKHREENKIPTVGVLDDLLTAKIMFQGIDNLIKALNIIDQMCSQKGYTILEMTNRLDQDQTQDVVLKILVRQTMCKLELAIQQDETHHNFINSLLQITQSPFGCIFSSYIYMSKGFNYPLLQNCKDIAQRLKIAESEQEKRVYESINYVIAELTHQPAK